MARPRKEFNWDELDKLCALHCSKTEVAWFFGIHPDTLDARIREKTGESFSVYFRKASSDGKISARRQLYKMMMNGNTSVAIFIAKNWLGMRDNPEMELDSTKPPLVIKFPEKREKSA